MASAISSLYFLGMAPFLNAATSNASKPRMASGAIRASFLMLFMSDIGGCSHWMALFLGEVGSIRKGAPRPKDRPLRRPQAQARALAAVALLIANSLPVAFLPNGDHREGRSAACCHEAARHVAIARFFQEFLDDAL